VAVSAACGAAAAPAKTTQPAHETIAPPPYESLAARPCPSDSALTWENFGEPYTRDWCTACHSSALDEAHRAGAPVDVNFDNLADVRALKERIWARSGDQNNTMPPAGYAPDPERLELGEWLACGARSRDD
ncbi:MAG TPA: hypothetical protein VGO62_05660, partial [Myxococcota bacterium]